jgi:protein phosphatase 1 regulatory subunit 3A/B/C/D/E
MTLPAHSVILVSTKVKNVDPEKRVFARCTDNGWQTYADLPAQFVGGVDNLGREFDRFCVAVRRPSTDRPPAENADASVPAAVVEFALCYEVNGRAYWDNNDLANYRIEWYDGPIPTQP